MQEVKWTETKYLGVWCEKQYCQQLTPLCFNEIAASTLTPTHQRFLWGFIKNLVTLELVRSGHPMHKVYTVTQFNTLCLQDFNRNGFTLLILRSQDCVLPLTSLSLYFNTGPSSFFFSK